MQQVVIRVGLNGDQQVSDNEHSNPRFPTEMNLRIYDLPLKSPNQSYDYINQSQCQASHEASSYCQNCI
jgi:hypothetical protein